VILLSRCIPPTNPPARCDSNRPGLRSCGGDGLVDNVMAERFQSHKGRLAASNAEKTSDNQLATYFREKEDREVFPWKTAMAAATVQIEHLRKSAAAPDAVETLRRTFVAQSRARLLHPMENVVCQYVLYGDAVDRLFLAHLLLDVPPASRLGVHNWNVAATMAAARREAYGTQIAALQFPLFPDFPDLMPLNSKLLAELPAVSGGSVRQEGDVYSKRAADTVWGGGLAAIYGPDGVQTHVLDTTGLESVLRGRGGYRGGRGHGKGQHNPHHGGNSSNHNNGANNGNNTSNNNNTINHNNNNSNNNNNANQRGRGGNGGGRGGGRGPWTGGGDIPKNEDQEE
jgi:hypothetical protein